MLAAAGILTFGLSSCDDDDVKPDVPPTGVGTVDLEMENVVGTQPLVLNVTQGTNANNETFKVTKFLYYVSNLKLTKTDGTVYAVPESYYLVNQADVTTHKIALKDIPAGDYNKISYIVGVDSARNVAGAQTGALDPANNMFWTWNSGYIYLKMEGTSAQSPTGALTFHIGGFKSPNSAIRTVTLNTPANINLQVRNDHKPEVHIKADVMKMFSGVTPVRFADTYTVMGGPNVVPIANNYTSGMFEIEHIHAN